jgi:hypothetical protein
MAPSRFVVIARPGLENHLRLVDRSEVSLLADRTAPDRATPQRRGGLAAAWASPVWVHLGVLAVVLVALMAVVGTSTSFSADEGAVIVQARSLAGGDGWFVDHPVPEVDPTGANFPLELSQHGPEGWAPFAKHPLYALLLAGADRLGGVPAMVLLSLLGTVAAAGLAAALARRLDPALSRPTVWVVGLASPLLFDGYLLIAHSAAAALAAAAVLAAVVAIERRRPAVALAAAPALAACVLLRSEGLFVALALAAAAGAVAIRNRPARAAAAVVALGAAAGGIGAYLLDRWWTAQIVGGEAVAGAAAPAATDSGGFLAGRIQGFVVTWLLPSYGGGPLVGLALFVMLLALMLGGLSLRAYPENGHRAVAWGAAAAAAALVALVAGPGTVVPGLLLAFPLAVPGLLLVRRTTLGSTTARLAAAVGGLFCLAVATTQYAKGGSGEWGGRYFALAIPIAVPVLLLALRNAGPRLDRKAARSAALALAVCSVAMAVMGLTALRSSHRAVAELVAAADRAPADVLVTTEGAMPRFAWPTFDRQRWLLATPEGLEDLLRRLREGGYQRVGFVTRHPDRDRPALQRAGAEPVDGTPSETVGAWEIHVLQIG